MFSWLREVRLPGDLILRAEQAVAVDADRRPAPTSPVPASTESGISQRHSTSRVNAGFQVIVAVRGVGELGAGRAAVLVQVAGDLHRALDAARDLARHAALAGRGRVALVETRVIVEVGRVALDHAVGEVRVAEARERVVADRRRAAGDALLAGDGEVPGHVEAGAIDAGLGDEVVDDRLHVGPARLDLGLVGDVVVAVDAEPDRRLDRLVVRVAQVAQRDDVALAEVEVLRRPDDQVDRAGVASGSG